ncbi:MAG: hypothetical protein MUE85_02810 [Microscillaceae bacterium]|nr:hypothetical protein [Microscillaceae bacterium]
MQAHIIHKYPLSSVPSASGVEFFAQKYYIIGDNSAGLFVLNPKYELLANINLFVPEVLEEGVIPKKLKPDFEALTTLTWKDKPKLLVLGSGSRPDKREKAYWVDLEDVSKVKKYSLKKVYQQIREVLSLSPDLKVNIEAACANAEYLCLFQRGNISGKNAMLVYELKNFIRFLKEKTSKLQAPQVFYYELPKIAGIQAGFSGASFVPNSDQIIFTASVEDTQDEIADGKMLGSFVGIINFSQAQQAPAIAPVKFRRKAFLGKIESITIREIQADGIQTLAVTDSDGGISEILELRVVV